MMSFVRKAARSWVAAVLIGLLVVSFAVWGINDVFVGGSKDDVAQIGKTSITSAEFRAEFERALKRIQNEAKRTVTTQEARAQGLDNSTLERMVGERSFALLLDKLGIKVSDAVVRDEISTIPGFQDPNTRRFSDAIYAQALQENNLNLAQFETSVRNDLARQLLMLAGTSGFRAPKVFANQTLSYATERRTVTMIAVPARLAGPPPVPTDAQLQQFYNQNLDKLTRPETRDLTIVIASLNDFMGKAQINEAQVRQLFETNKDKLATPAKRTFVQIVAPTQIKADEAAKRLRAGENPNAIATALGLQTPLSFSDVALSQVPDKKVGAAVFAGGAGNIGAIQGDLAFAAFQVSAVKALIPADFNAFAPAVRENMRKEAAGQALTEATEGFDDAIAQGETIEAAATKAGFKLVKIANVTADGKDGATGAPNELLTASIDALNEAFGLAQNDNTDLLSAGRDMYMALRVDKITAKAPVPLATVKAELSRAWVGRELSLRLKARAEAILADAKATSIEQAATKAGLSIVRAPQPLMRGQGSPELSQAIFNAKKGEIVTGAVANGVEFAVVRIDNIIRDDETKAPERLAQAEQEVRKSVQSDIVAGLEAAARNRARVRLFQDRMGRALGDTTETPTTTPAKK